MSIGQGTRVQHKVLVVDDDRLVLSLFAQGLTDAGYSVVTAESAEEAEALLGTGERPDLALLDVRMPGRGGLYLAQRLRDLDHIPFMMLSAYSDTPTVEQAAASGAMGYVVKPLDIVHLIPAVEAALARANDLQELRETRQRLQSALDGERSIGVATGLCMVKHRLKRSDALNLLRATASQQQRKLANLADEFVESANQTGRLPPRT